MAAPAIVWFRQDLRLADHAALTAAAKAGPVIAAYVLDDAGPGDWAIGGAQRWWLHHSLASLSDDLARHGVQLVLRRGGAAVEIGKLADEAGAGSIHAIRHYEPWWRAAERALGERVTLHDGYLLADPDRVRTGSGGRFRIFSPFWRALQQLMPPPAPLPVPKLAGAARLPSDSLKDWGLLPTKPDWASGFAVWTPGEASAQAALPRFLPKLDAYQQDRNLPSIEGSSALSPHLHHGEISPAAVWHAAADAKGDAAPFLRELGWRDFTSNLIEQMPRYGDEDGRDALKALKWRQDAADLRAWQRGRTGYPIVDAGMRQLWAIGWMHNRVRMITASFLIKHLLIDWREGERWFWDCLIDADYGNNSVNWQWVAGTGVDYNQFGRIMAPLVQSPKFDAGDYIRRWVPELAGLDDDAIHDPHGAGIAVAGYPTPIIGHREARERALAAGRIART